jgi:hypothetical protein
MKLTISSVAVFLLVSATVKAQTIPVICRFTNNGNQYVCNIDALTIPDNQNADISIGGTHLPGFSDIQVTGIMINNSNIPFVITQLFTRFRAVQNFFIINGGLTRIQSNAFNNARNLREIHIRLNTNLRTIESNGFAGLAAVTELNLFSNSIESIHEDAFTGLSSLRGLQLSTID